MNRQSFVKKKYDHYVRDTSLAILFIFGFKEVWIPKDRCVVYKVSKTVEIESWLYEKIFGE